MRALLCLVVLALPMMAAAGPPTAEDLASAKADCAVEVQQDCLFVLAIGAALTEERADPSDRALNIVATAQARAGDAAGADRTLSFASADEGSLLALGRWDEAYAVAERQFPDLIVEQGSAEGSFKITMVRHMLAANDIDRAFATALSIQDGWGERDAALFLIFNHHLETGDLAAAAAVQDLMRELDSSIRNKAFLALIDANAAAGQMTEAAALLDSRDADPETVTQARLRLAKSLFAAGQPAKATAQFDLVLASASGVGERGQPDWGVPALIDAANLALSLGETTLARPFAEAAFSAIDEDRANVGSWFVNTTANPINLIRVATLLQLVGASDKAAILFADAAMPPTRPENSQQEMLRKVEMLVSEFRLKDSDAAQVTLQQLMQVEDGPDAWLLGDFLSRAGLALVDHGLLADAQQVAEALETLPYGRGTSHAVYMALLARDPALAPGLLPGIRGAYLQVEVSVIWARSLAASGDLAKAQAVLQALAEDHAGRGNEDYPLPSYRTQAMAEIAKAQDSLGFADGATATRARGLAFAGEDMVSGLRVDALLSLAASFR